MRSRHAGGVAAMIGLIGLMPLTRNARFESFHTVDVLQLLASGMCFGVALAGLFNKLRTTKD
jgi:hypothetical protein